MRTKKIWTKIKDSLIRPVQDKKNTNRLGMVLSNNYVLPILIILIDLLLFFLFNYLINSFVTLFRAFSTEAVEYADILVWKNIFPNWEFITKSDTATYIYLWKKMGYNVLSGQHGLKVRIPIHTTWLKINNEEFVKLSEATAAQKEAYQKGMIEGFEKLSFGIGNVFDISQTDFPKDQYPKLFNMGYPSAQHLNICRGIEDFASEQLHCPVLQSNLKSISLRGVYLPEINVIKINERLEDTQRLCTTLHELGHALIHSEKLSRNKPVSQKELEADALSIMIQANYGLELTEARKMHFKNHYDSFIETLKGTDKDPFTEIDSIFKSVFHSYKEHIESINDYVFNRINLNIENHHSLQPKMNDKSLHIKQSKHQKISIDR